VATLFVSVIFADLPRLSAIQITGYSATANDRFSSGFPTVPIENTSGSFVGAGYDWSGVGWATTDGTKGFVFLSLQLYLVANHYGGSASITLNGDNGLVSASQDSVTNSGAGVVLNGQPDISIGKLSAPVSSSVGLPRYAVLDLNPTSASDSTSAYTNLSLFLYGRGANGSSSPRVGTTTGQFVTYQDIGLTYVTPRTAVQLETGDSGSPTFSGWTNPNGDKALTLIGFNSAIDTTNGFNILSFLGTAATMNAVNAVMISSGYALRVAGNPTGTWQGGAGSPSQRDDLFRAGNWSNNVAPSDVYSLFDAGTSTNRAVDVNASGSIRGLYFKSTAADDGFTFSGANTLTIGRGGITNYDNSRQVFDSQITLGDHQYWDVGAGGVTLQNLNTNGKLLEISGVGTAIFNGVVSGGGGLALSGGRLELSGTSSYTGNTWVHSGTLLVNGDISASFGVILADEGNLSGSGRVGTISGSGSVNPGNSPGILTATSVDPSGGLDFFFEFTQTGSPVYSNAGSSGNDVLRLTGGTPFLQSLAGSNTVNIFLDVATLAYGATFRGGFFTDNDVDFLTNIQSAAFVFYLLNAGGSYTYNGANYSLYSGPYDFDLLTVVQQNAPFSSGTESGYVTQFTAVPEPGSVMLFVLGSLLAGFFVFRRGRMSNQKSQASPAA